MAHKTKAVRNDKYDTETIMTQVNSLGFIYRTEGNKALIEFLVERGLLQAVSDTRYEKRVKLAN